MALSISTQAIIEKNKRFSSNPFIVLLEIQHQSLEENIYLCNNNTDLLFNSKTWKAVSFALSETNETKEAEIPEVSLQVTDLSRQLILELDNFDGGAGASVFVHIINTGIPDEYLRTMLFNINRVDVNSNYVITFKLGVNKLNSYRSPKDKWLKSHCRYKIFKGDECQYTGDETECNRTFKRCKELQNQSRFGGAPGIGSQGIFK